VGQGIFSVLPSLFRITIEVTKDERIRKEASYDLNIDDGSDVVRFVTVSDYVQTLSEGMCITILAVFVGARGKDVTAGRSHKVARLVGGRSKLEDDYNTKEVTWEGLRKAYEYVLTAVGGEGQISFDDTTAPSSVPPPKHLENLERAGWVKASKTRRRFRSQIPPELAEQCAEMLQADPAMFI